MSIRDPVGSVNQKAQPNQTPKWTILA